MCVCVCVTNRRHTHMYTHSHMGTNLLVPSSLLAFLPRCPCLVVGLSGKHEPTVSVSKCSAGIGHLKIKFHGGASWLYNLFSSVIAGACFYQATFAQPTPCFHHDPRTHIHTNMHAYSHTLNLHTRMLSDVLKKSLNNELCSEIDSAIADEGRFAL